MLTIRPLQCSTNHGERMRMKPGKRDRPDAVLFERSAEQRSNASLLDALAVERPGREARAPAPNRGPARSGLFDATSTTS